MHMIKIQDEENIHLLDKILSQSEEKLILLKAKKEFATSLNSKSDNILNAWDTLIKEKNLISVLEKELAHLNQLEIMNPEIVIKYPKVNKKQIIKVIRQMSFIQDESEKNTKQNSIILFQENYSKKIEKHSLTFERRFLFTNIRKKSSFKS